MLGDASDDEHQRQAMDAVWRDLVMHDAGIGRLFTPPFDRTLHNPGYIKGYPPGIRENGGQYTHGSAWSIFAYAQLGDGDRAAALYGMLTAIRHSHSADSIARYKVEPYVACADVYSVGELTGRGGWTWYTGAAGWLYRAGIEAVLGLRKRGDDLLIAPCIPADWPGFSLRYRHTGASGAVTPYDIDVENPRRVQRGVVGAQLDDGTLAVEHGVARIALVQDGRPHRVRIVLG